MKDYLKELNHCKIKYYKYFFFIFNFKSYFQKKEINLFLKK